MSMGEVYCILVKENKWMTQKEISEKSGLSQSSVFFSIKRLMQRGEIFWKFKKGTKNPGSKIYKHKELK